MPAYKPDPNIALEQTLSEQLSFGDRSVLRSLEAGDICVHASPIPALDCERALWLVHFGLARIHVDPAGRVWLRRTELGSRLADRR